PAALGGLFAFAFTDLRSKIPVRPGGAPVSPASRVLGLLALVLTASSAAANTYSVLNAHDSGGNSLRAAITSATGVAGPHRVVFAIPAAGVQTIHLLTPLPAIHNKTAID